MKCGTSAPWLSVKFSDSVAQSRVQVRPGAWSNQNMRTKLLTLSKGAHFKNALATIELRNEISFIIYYAKSNLNFVARVS